MNFSILFPGRLGNQLIILYYIYNTYDNINKIYAPYFDMYKEYFKINKFCDESYYINNKETFIDIGWYPSTIIENYCDIKFEDLKLKDKYNDIIKNIVELNFKNENIVAVHIRQSDFKIWLDGKFYFSTEKYIEECFKKIKEWNLENYQIVIFSDEEQIFNNENFIKSSSLTNFNSVLDLFLMSECNYFISVLYSTYSKMAINLSIGSKKFKNNFYIE